MAFNYNLINKSIDYNICELDSSIMNFGVAKIHIHDVSTDPIEIINLLRSKSISLIYLRSNTKHNNAKLKNFPGMKFMVQNIKYILEINCNNYSSIENLPVDIIAYNDQIPVYTLEKLVGLCNQYSHLKKDLFIKKKHADELYMHWLYRALTDRNNKGIFIAKINNKVIGMLVFSKKVNSINIDLIAVDKKMRRKKHGTKLIEALICFANKNDITHITVETQNPNIPANRLYENIGFKIVNRQNIFHCWL